MKFVKRLVIVFVVYAGIVAAFETMIGILQPAGGDTLVITTSAADGSTSDRVLAHLESGGQSYVAANHWPRAWYKQALAYPMVEATIDGEKRAYLAVPVSGEEHDRLQAEHAHGTVFKLLTGFPPRYFLRLDRPPAAQ